MDHAAVREWLEEAFFTPGALEADDATAGAVRAHVGECRECAAHAVALRMTALKLDLARGPSPQLRERVLETARRVGRPRPAVAKRAIAPPAAAPPPWWQTGLAWRFATAVLVVGIVGAALGAWWAGSINPGSTEGRQLADAVAMMADLSGRPGTNELVLRDVGGAAAGVVLVSNASHQVAVFTASLPRSAQGTYDCYLERAGQRTWIGPMHWTEGVQFWAGQMSGSMAMAPGDQLVVAQDESGAAVLSAAL
jgi:hypothetical protein